MVRGRPDGCEHREGTGYEMQDAQILKNGIRFVLLIAVLCIFAYLPAFNNGFISDDYVILGRLDTLQHDPWRLFSEPPECFRLTSYLCFGALRFLFGYHAEAYYGFNLLLHIINSLLIWKLVSELSGSAQTGMLAGVLFATFQGHQEATMWLAAMNESLLGFFLLSCLLLWKRRRIAGAACTYLAALFSKESALMLIGLLPWMERASERQGRRRIAYGLLISISIGYVALFLALVARNFMLTSGTYSLGFHAIPVFLRSMHRLLFPWIYLAFVIVLTQRRRVYPAAPAVHGLVFAAIAFLPYVFLTYQHYVPSRQEYLASAGSAWSLAVLIREFSKPAWRKAFIAIFIVVNMGYLWFRKDAQFEQRAAPTNQLIEVLRATPPRNLALSGFPGNPWIARNTFRLAPGWKMEFIHVDADRSECQDCMRLRWDPDSGRYIKQQ